MTTVNIVLCVAMLAAGGYRLFLSRKDKMLLLGWALMIIGGISAPLSRVVPTGKLLTLLIGIGCLAGGFLILRKHKAQAVHISSSASDGSAS